MRYALAHGAQDVVLYSWSIGGCMVETFLRRSSYAAQTRAVVLDAPILDWHKAIDTQMHKLHFPHWFTCVVEWTASRRAGINFAALNHERLAHERTTPTRLFHGTADANNLSHVVSRYCGFLSNASRSQCARFAPASYVLWQKSSNAWAGAAEFRMSSYSKKNSDISGL